MTSRSRTFPWLVATVLACLASPSKGQDAPLYRDPSPTEGPRIEGPLLPSTPPRPGSTPPPPSSLGPFQPANPSSAAPALAPPGEPLLGIPPIAPPLPAIPMQPFSSGGDVLVRRKTTLWSPRGAIGQFHERFHVALFGPPKPSSATGLKRLFFGESLGEWQTIPPEGDILTRLLNWPAWPIWPIADGH